jgi:hypothetical protein
LRVFTAERSAVVETGPCEQQQVLVVSGGKEHHATRHSAIGFNCLHNLKPDALDSCAQLSHVYTRILAPNCCDLLFHGAQLTLLPPSLAKFVLRFFILGVYFQW